MSAVDLHAEILERLGTGDAVFAAEALKDKARAVATQLAAGDANSNATTAEERIAAFLAPIDAPAEKLLAALLPIVEYGDPRALDAIPRSFNHLARQTSLIGSDLSWRKAAGTLVVGRLVWAIASYAVHCGRLDGLRAAWRAIPPPRYDEDPTPLLADASLRYADAFDRHAGKSYEDYKSWLIGRELVRARYALFVAEFDDVFAEGDLMLALRAEAATPYGVYAPGLTRATVARFRRHLTDREFRLGLASLFGIELTELDATLAAAYRSLKSDRQGFDSAPAQLFSE